MAERFEFELAKAVGVVREILSESPDVPKRRDAVRLLRAAELLADSVEELLESRDAWRKATERACTSLIKAKRAISEALPGFN